MTVEIRELIIRASIGEVSGVESETIEPEDGNTRNEMISACVGQVLKILERSKER